MKRWKTRRIVLAGIAVSLMVIAGVILGVKSGRIFTFFQPCMKTFETSPPLTHWKPQGIRPAPCADPVVGSRNFYRTLHSTVVNSDEVSIAYAPVYKYEWTAEENSFVVEGPTFDNHGNLYFSPLMPLREELVVSLDCKTGRRNWAVTGHDPGGSGPPLILDDPDNPGQQMIYSVYYDRGMAISQTGSVLWETPTGWTVPTTGRRYDTSDYHCFGANYHPETDAIVAFMGDGHAVAFDRRSGKRLSNNFLLPGEHSPRNQGGKRVPPEIVEKMSFYMKEIMDLRDKDPLVVIEAILGEGCKIANFFAVVPQTGRIWVAGTAPDETDGKKDGISEYGALYGLNFSKENGFEIVSRTDFEGGSSTTPALSADGKRIYMGDALGNLIAVDDGGHVIWKVDVGSQIGASITVGSDNHELFAVTLNHLFKVVDKGDHGVLEWDANLENLFDLSPLQDTANLNTAGVGANGVMAQVGAGFSMAKIRQYLSSAPSRNVVLPMAVGNALIDRETGEVRYAALGREESVAAMTTGPDGALYLGHSPLRRVLSKVFLKDSVEPITGGIGKYAPKNLIRMTVEAAHAGADRAENLMQYLGTPGAEASARADIVQIGQLLGQAENAARQALGKSEITHKDYESIYGDLDDAGDALARTDLKRVVNHLRSARDHAMLIN